MKNWLLYYVIGLYNQSKERRLWYNLAMDRFFSQLILRDNVQAFWNPTATTLQTTSRLNANPRGKIDRTQNVLVHIYIPFTRTATLHSDDLQDLTVYVSLCW